MGVAVFRQLQTTGSFLTTPFLCAPTFIGQTLSQNRPFRLESRGALENADGAEPILAPTIPRLLGGFRRSQWRTADSFAGYFI